jgi:hypothetical protein
MTTNVDVQNKEQITINIINNIDISIFALELNEWVDVSVLFKHDEKFISSQVVRIAGEEYKAWGNNDDYLIAVVCQKLGLVPILPPT